jgi:hypothetical protein
MRLLKLFASLSLLLSLIGCATIQAPIPLSSNVFDYKTKKIGIIYTDIPKAETVYTGSIGLLDYAIISATNNSLDKHLATLSFPEYETFVKSIRENLENNGLDLVLVDPPLNRKAAKGLKRPTEGQSKNDFSTQQSKYNLDMILLIDFKSVGTTRSYYGFIPTSEPLAQSVITGQLIDLSSNELLWYSNTVTKKTIPTPWDEVDGSFPNLTTTVYQSLDESFKVINYELEGNTPLNIVAENSIDE